MVHFDNILHTVSEDKILTLLLYNKKKREPQSFLFPFELQFRISWAEKSQSHTHQLLMVTLLKYYQKKGLPCGLPHMSLRAQLLAVERLEWRSLKSEPVQNCACSIDVMWLDLPSRGSNPVIFFVRYALQSPSLNRLNQHDLHFYGDDQHICLSRFYIFQFLCTSTSCYYL